TAAAGEKECGAQGAQGQRRRLGDGDGEDAGGVEVGGVPGAIRWKSGKIQITERAAEAREVEDVEGLAGGGSEAVEEDDVEGAVGQETVSNVELIERGAGADAGDFHIESGAGAEFEIAA